MKMFTKLALVSSMAISANAMAMQSMDDAALSATTGQDGINIGIGISRVTIEKVLIHDTDGYASVGTGPVAAVPAVLYVAGDPAIGTTVNGKVVAVGDVKTPAVPAVPASMGWGGTSTDGAIVIKGNGISGNVNQTNGIVITTNTAALLPSDNLADIVIDTDAGTGTNGAFLNVAAEVSGLNIAIGEIGVSASGTAGTTNIRRGHSATNYNAILSGLKITTGTMDANIQLGAAPQGAMIVLNTSMTGGLEITDLGILDNSTKLGTGATTGSGNRAAGEIRLDSIKVADANGADLTVNAKVNVIGESDAGKGYLKISAMDTASDIYIKGVHLGSATAGSIGDVEVQGMQTYYSPSAGVYTKGAVITISGH